VGDQRPPLLDQNPDKLFRAYQEAGVIPPHYSNWQELEADFASRVKDGITEKQARIDMGVDYRNIDGQYLLGKNIASDGSTRYLNKRAIRTDFNPVSERVLREHAGNENVDNYKNKIQTEWNKHTKGEAQQMGRETGKEFHRGHVQSAMHGGGLTQENMYPEHGMRNVLHGSEPRIPVPIMEDNGIALNDIQAYYNAQLDAEGLGITRPNNALMIAADETMVDPTGGKSYIRNNEAGRVPETIEATQNRLNQLEAQGVSRQAIENWSRDQSATLSRGNAIAQSGPVRVVQPAVQKPVKIIEPGKARPTTRLVPSGSAGSIAPKPVAKPVVLTIKPPPAAQTAKLAAGIKIPKVNPKVLALGAAMPGAVGTVFDGAALASGANELRSKDPRTQLAGALDAVSGATGLAAIAPTPASVPLGITSAGSGLLSTAVRNKVDQKAIKAAPKVAATVHKTNNALQPVSNAITKGLQIGGNWLLQKMGIGK
jgi:hypothetical protein